MTRQEREKTAPENQEPAPDGKMDASKAKGGPRSAAAFFGTLWGAFTVVVVATGVLVGFGIGQTTLPYLPELAESLRVYFISGIAVAAGRVFFLLSQILFRKLVTFLTYLERVSLDDKLAAVVGVVLGLLVGYLATAPLAAYGHLTGVRLFAMIVMVGLGVAVAMSAKGQLSLIFAGRPGPAGIEPETGLPRDRLRQKFLDTNIIIDGRIADIGAAGFIEGELLVPAFILHELQQIADSADPMKRSRGRRGLDVLDRMRNELHIGIRPYEDYPDDYDEGEGVDYRLVKLARARDGVILTNDYNLNKIASLHGVPVLNVNELANAVKPVYLPGEQLETTIVKEGKEPGQGVGYLDDGTMVVVENASDLVGQVILITVSSTYQTQAGKMIFAELATETEIPTVARKRRPPR